MGDSSYRTGRGHLYSFLFGVVTTLLFYYTFIPRGSQIVTPPAAQVSLEDLSQTPSPPSSLTQLFPGKAVEEAPAVAQQPPSLTESLLPAFFSQPSSTSTGTPTATPSTTPSAPPPPPPPPSPPAPAAAAVGGPPQDTLFAGTLGKVNERGEVYEMDGVYGPGMSEAWLPNRRIAHLDLGLEGAHAPIFVDNWFAYHHGGAEALKWSGLTAGLSLVGEAKVHPSTPKRRAPPLPTCQALDATGHLTLPPDLNVQGFKEYSSTALIQRGRDDGEFVGAMKGSEAGGGAPGLATSLPPDPPPSYVRALPWHRLYHNDTGDFHAALTSSPAGQAMLYASMTPHSRAKYCSVNGEGINPDFAPAVRCDGSPNPTGPSTRYPYCNRATAPVMVMSLDCAFVDSINHVNVIVWNVITLDGGGHVVTYNGHPRWELRTAEAVTEFEELACAGTSVYPDAPGHLFNEILPRLIHLDTVLPLHIPLLWPPGDLPRRLLVDLQAAGLISPDRTFVQQPGKAMLYRAKRLYVYTSDYGSGHTPLILYTSQRFFAARLHSRTLAKAAAAEAAAAAAAAGSKQPPPPPSSTMAS